MEPRELGAAVARLAAAVRELPEARRAHLFGSRVRGRARSDMAVDIVMLNDAPLLLRHRVLRDGMVLHAGTPEDRVRSAVATP